MLATCGFLLLGRERLNGWGREEEGMCAEVLLILAVLEGIAGIQA